MQMRSDSRTLLWGAVVAFVLVVSVWLLAIKFPNVHISIAREWQDLGLVTALLVAVFISAYRSLLGRVGYWLILAAFLAAHVGICAIFFLRAVGERSPLQADMLYGILAGIEFTSFALAIFKIYGVGPEINWL